MRSLRALNPDQPLLWSNSENTSQCRIDVFFTPTSQEEIVEVIQKARLSKKSIKVLGAGHSTNAIASPDDHWALSLEKHSKILEVDPIKRTITAQGGATLKQINDALNDKGLALENLGSISDQTVGGVIQTGTHGTGKAYGALHTQVTGMTLINGKGEVKAVSPNIDPELFRASQCGLGVLGVVDSVTFRAVPACHLREITYPGKWPDIIEQLDHLIETNERFRFYWFPYTSEVGIWTANRFENPINTTSPSLTKNSVPVSNLIEAIRLEPLGQSLPLHASLDDILELAPTQPTHIERINRALFLAEYQTKTERIGNSVEILNFDCSGAKHYVREAAIPMHNAEHFLRELRPMIEESSFPAHGSVEVRFVKSDSAWLSPTYSDEKDKLFCYVSILVRLPHGKHVPFEAYFCAFEALAKKYQGRFHWGKAGKIDPTYLSTIYPKWNAFKKIRKLEDPDGIFLNNLTRSFLEKHDLSK